ncbi:acid-sensing ion channel 4 isoform X2 [Cephus cinctus]|uniref:Acid-sensing ion channel 4 isoform X2 n=1 Tax=Cephus cinctus TaxID=211228 RepID=A0AAJ7RJS2_CEPCN|nr:acid-sensing ion channel 4 isoform X2 [Cephus cinctus]
MSLPEDKKEPSNVKERVKRKFTIKVKDVQLREQLSKLIRYITLAGCLIAMLVQLKQCFQKLTVPPVTTHTRFHVNDSLWYPALTLCREPPFRKEVLTKYGLAASPRYTSHWRNFPWNEATIEQMYTEATYPANEILLLYGLNGEERNIQLESAFYFESGMCHTLLPKATTTEAGVDVGYSILVTHSGDQGDNQPSGWHLYVHEPSENWTEHKMQSLGRQEALYVEVGEEIHVRIAVQEFHHMNTGQTRYCVDNVDGGEVRCAERCRWEQKAVDNCVAPWMPGVDLPECDNDNDTIRLIISYLKFDQCTGDCCGCKPSCRFVRYDALPVTRKPFPEPMSQIYVYFTARLVTLMEEKSAYDLSTFIAELGGSLGFLLGLSVLGLLSFFEKCVDLVIMKIPKKSIDTSSP